MILRTIPHDSDSLQIGHGRWGASCLLTLAGEFLEGVADEDRGGFLSAELHLNKVDQRHGDFVFVSGCPGGGEGAENGHVGVAMENELDLSADALKTHLKRGEDDAAYDEIGEDDESVRFRFFIPKLFEIGVAVLFKAEIDGFGRTALPLFMEGETFFLKGFLEEGVENFQARRGPAGACR